MKAAFLVATYQRPVLLRGCLEHLQRSVVPEGWSLEIVVAAIAGDHGIPVAEEFGVRCAIGKNRKVGRQFQRALEATDADLIMTSGDDVLQSPHRMSEAVKAFEAGAQVSGTDGLWFFEWDTGRVSAWRDGMVMRLGAVQNWSGALLRKVGGWSPVANHNDSTLHRRLTSAGLEPEPVVLSRALRMDTVSIHTPTNLSRACPFGTGIRTLGSFTVEMFDGVVSAPDVPMAARKTIAAMQERAA